MALRRLCWRGMRPSTDTTDVAGNPALHARILGDAPLYSGISPRIEATGCATAPRRALPRTVAVAAHS